MSNSDSPTTPTRPTSAEIRDVLDRAARNYAAQIVRMSEYCSGRHLDQLHDTERVLRWLSSQDLSVLTGGDALCFADVSCGHHDSGCGKQIPRGQEYRCLDCGAVMHKDCLRRHCSADEKDALIGRLERTIQVRNEQMEQLCAPLTGGDAPATARETDTDDGEPWFGCFTSDCPHQTQAECDAAIRKEFARLERVESGRSSADQEEPQ
jgi:hypothetical protein